MDRRRAIGWMLVLALGLAGCARQGTETRAGTMKFLALGDSYTIGEGVAASDRWPVQLAALLREQGQDFAEPQIIARTGWTTDELSDAIDGADPQGPYDLVSLLIGVNNQYRGRGTEEYRDEFAGLLQRAIGFAGGDARRVIVLSIPDWGATPFAEGRSRDEIAGEIDVFNAINRQETERLGVRYVDITAQSRTAGSNPTFLAPDGLHYSGLTYAEWARLSLPVALEAVQ